MPRFSLFVAFVKITTFASTFIHSQKPHTMIYFFRNKLEEIIAVQSGGELSAEDISKLEWLFGEAVRIEADRVDGWFVGPRREMITP